MPEIKILNTNNNEDYFDSIDLEDLKFNNMSINDAQLLQTFIKMFTQDDKMDSTILNDILLIVDKHKHKMKHLKERSAKNGSKLDDLERFLSILLQDDFDKELKTEKFLRKQE